MVKDACRRLMGREITVTGQPHGVGHDPLRRAAHRRHRAASGQGRGDGHRRGKDPRRDDAALSERPRGPGRPSGHGELLPRPARRGVDGHDLPLPRPHRGRDRPARPGLARAAGGLRRRHHVRDQQRVRLRLPARQHGPPARAAGPARARLRDHRRGGLDPDRRGPDAPDHLGPGGTRYVHAVQAVQPDGRRPLQEADAGHQRAGGRGREGPRGGQRVRGGREAPRGEARDAEAPQAHEAVRGRPVPSDARQQGRRRLHAGQAAPRDRRAAVLRDGREGAQRAPLGPRPGRALTRAIRTPSSCPTCRTTSG